MTILTIFEWYFSLSIAATLGYVFGTCIAIGKRADEDMAAPQRRSTIIGSCGRNSEPHLVLISPTEMREVKTI